VAGRPSASSPRNIFRTKAPGDFGRGYAAEPHVIIEELNKDEAINEADTLSLTIPNQLGVAYNAHVMEAVSHNCRSSSRLALKSGRRYFRNCGWQSEMKRHASSVVRCGPQTATMRFHD
jgi:hypothetical protein